MQYIVYSMCSIFKILNLQNLQKQLICFQLSAITDNNNHIIYKSSSLDFCSFTLDPNTAIEHLVLSENNRQMTHTGHLGIYKFPCKVFCKESVFGRCYWEVEWNGRCVHISVSYKEMSGRGKGLVGMFGNNNTSWSLQCFPKPVFWHKSIKTEISRPLSSRVGVFVDYKAGTLSFYSVSDTVTLLHRVQTTFTQPLYPGFWFSASGSGDLLNLDNSGSNTNVFSSVKLCDP